jgi:iron complex transport system substrate-binding protein
MRIVSLISSGTEILFALGLGPHVLAVSHECDFPPSTRNLPRLTRSWIDSSRASSQIDAEVRHRLASGNPLYEIDAELLCRLQPELIVTQAQCDVCAVRLADVVDLVESRRELARSQVVALNPQSLGDVLADIGRIGAAAHAQPAAGALISRLRTRVAAVEQATSSLAESSRPRVVCIEWIEPLMTAGNWTPELIELAGGSAGLAVAGRHSEYVSWDAIRRLNPEVLLVAPCGFDLARSQIEAANLAKLPGYGELRAVRDGRAWVLDGNAYLNRSGPRLVESLELLASLIHPELFGARADELAEGRAWSRL